LIVIRPSQNETFSLCPRDIEYAVRVVQGWNFVLIFVITIMCEQVQDRTGTVRAYYLIYHNTRLYCPNRLDRLCEEGQSTMANQSLKYARRIDLYNSIFSALHHNIIIYYYVDSVDRRRVLHVVSPTSYIYKYDYRMGKTSVVQDTITYIRFVYTYTYILTIQHCTAAAAADLRCLLIGRSRKMACRRRIIILLYEGFHRFRVGLDHPCSRERFPRVYMRSIIRRRRRHVEGTGRED